MPGKKPSKLPRWGELAGNYGVVGPNEVEPNEGKKDIGWVPADEPPAENFNWFKRLVYDWLQYFNERSDQLQAFIASSWSKKTSGTARDLCGVAAVPSGAAAPTVPNFIAVGDAAVAPITLLTSDDAETWTARVAVGTSVQPIGAAIKSDGSFAVVIMNGASGQNCQTSPDGINWTLRATGIVLGGAGAGFGQGGAVYSPRLGLWCIVGGVGGAAAVSTSPDGINWTARALGGANNSMVSVCEAPSLGLLIAAGINLGTSAVEVFTSPDGINWTQRAMPASTIAVCSVAWSEENHQACIVGGIAAFASFTSSDGITWAAAGGLAEGFASIVIFGGPVLLNTGAQWLACVFTGSRALIFSSVDGAVTWSKRREMHNPPGARAITKGPLGLLLAVGTAGQIWQGNAQLS